MPAKLGEQLKLMHDRNLRLVHGSAVLIDALGEKIGQRVMAEVVNQSMIMRRNFIISSSELLDADHFGLIYQNSIRNSMISF